MGGRDRRGAARLSVVWFVLVWFGVFLFSFSVDVFCFVCLLLACLLACFRLGLPLFRIPRLKGPSSIGNYPEAYGRSPRVVRGSRPWKSQKRAHFETTPSTQLGVSFSRLTPKKTSGVLDLVPLKHFETIQKRVPSKKTQLV